MMQPADIASRERALDPLMSCCVSAPAGSGKTSLLVQRFLVLLQRVKSPESIVAVTFTRKAAAEMRARLVEILNRAASGYVAESPYESAQITLARSVLERDRELAWNLLGNTSRLQIQTIDSYCGELTRQMPIRSGSGGPVAPSDDSSHLYQLATEAFFDQVLSSADHSLASDARSVLLHLDNNWVAATELFGRLLQKREQWQLMLGAGGLGGDSRSWLLNAFEGMLNDRVERLNDKFATHLDLLHGIVDFSANQLGIGSELSPFSVEFWRHAREVLLTKQGAWRGRLTVKQGFPAGKGEQALQKAAASALIVELSGNAPDELRYQLHLLASIPDSAMGDGNWKVLTSITRLLPLLSAQLLLVFQQQGEVDHPQIAMGALDALGSDATPSDISLRLDYTLEHLLVDEFQDTSSLQFELVRRLTRGWYEHNQNNPEAARTLFLVGDPMQSIYGFREANVGLFIKARTEGVGDLLLEPLELSMNFRSRAGVVDWVNQQFVGAFPVNDEVSDGAVRFRSSIAARPNGEAPDLQIFTGESAQAAEAEAICDRLELGLDDPAVGSIAILGRSRSQLIPVITAMRQRGIPASGNDLDALGQRPVIRDMMTLCDVLFDSYDSFAWLCLMRTPAFGFDHADLLCLSEHWRDAATLRATGGDGLRENVAMSREGQERLLHARQWLLWIDRYRDRLALRVLVEEAWLRLGGAAACHDEVDARDVEQFLACVHELEQSGKPVDKRSLRNAVNRLYANSGGKNYKIQVMTLHKAKGLEFDWVFIPGLGRTTRGSDRDLLRWEEFALPGAGSGFLMDVKPEAGNVGGPTLYDYLGEQLKQKSAYESVRLFYVGCTRAANRLWLSAVLSEDESTGQPKPPPKGSLLAAIWDTAEYDAVHCNVDAPNEAEESGESSAYWRVADLPRIEKVTLIEPNTPVLLEDSSVLPRALGTAVHRCLESLVYRDGLPVDCDSLLIDLLRSSLARESIPNASVDDLVLAGTASLNASLADEWLRWSLDSARESRHAELPLSLVEAESGQNLIVDYTFRDEARRERWIVDYKTAAPLDGEKLEDFLAAQTAQFRDQLMAYRTACRGYFGDEARCALYFTSLAMYHEVCF